MYALVDCDNFFCSCERVFRPDLNGKPLVVLSNNDGCVVARSAESKALGVKTGLPYYQLLENYPRSGIIAFSSNYSLYADMSARVMASEITTDAAIQPDLFTYNPDMARKYRRLSDAMDEINARLGNDNVILASQQYSATDAQGKHVRFSGAIRRSMKSPDYSTKIDDFKVN